MTHLVLVLEWLAEEPDVVLEYDLSVSLLSVPVLDCDLSVPLLPVLEDVELECDLPVSLLSVLE